MAEVKLPCGASTTTLAMDDHMELVRQEATLPLEPEPDIAAGVKRALDAPIDRPPLNELAKGMKRVTVAFDDPTVPCYAPVWQAALTQIVDQLNAAGVADEGITLLCANALHRQFTHEELGKTIGQALVDRFGERLLCHDAEDSANMVHFGHTEQGHDVEVNRLATDTDLCIYLNTSCWRAFNGGWKSVCVGLSTYRSIKWHHTPDVMSMSIEKNQMHATLEQMGAILVDKLGDEQFFKVETVLANPMQLGKMWSGSVAATRKEVLSLFAQKGKSRRDLLDEKADIVCYGVPAWSPYAAYAKMNPLLTLVSTGLGYLGGVIEALGKPGCSVVLATPCKDEWDDVHHPSYREVWQTVLADCKDPYEIRRRYEGAYAKREDYLEKYRRGFGFHPTHGIMATYPLKRLKHAARIFVAHADAPLVEHLGFIPTSSMNDGIAQARAIHGAQAKVAVVKYPTAFNRQ